MSILLKKAIKVFIRYRLSACKLHNCSGFYKMNLDIIIYYYLSRIYNQFCDFEMVGQADQFWPDDRFGK